MAYNPSPNYVPNRGHSPSFGGFSPDLQFFLTAGTMSNGNQMIGAFDPSSGYNDVVDGGFHYFRIEEVVTMRYPNIRRVGIIYRDMGVATIQVVLSAVDDNGLVVTNAVKGQYPSFTIGTPKASQRLCQKFLDTHITGMLPQVGIIRAANAGPVSISKIWMETEVEQTSY